MEEIAFASTVMTTPQRQRFAKILCVFIRSSVRLCADGRRIVKCEIKIDTFIKF